jgi:hypothetical protein
VSDDQCATCERCTNNTCTPIPAGEPSTRCPDATVCNEIGQCAQCLGDFCDDCNRCVNGACQIIPDNPPCGGLEAGTCTDDGRCVRCLVDSNCAACDFCQLSTNTCEHLGAGDPGRCNTSIFDAQLVCDGGGTCVQCVDDSVCGNSCNTCVNGTCQPTVAAGELCGDGLLCDGTGRCLQCLNDLQCLNPAVEFCDITIGQCVPRP